MGRLHGGLLSAHLCFDMGMFETRARDRLEILSQIPERSCLGAGCFSHTNQKKNIRCNPPEKIELYGPRRMFRALRRVNATVTILAACLLVVIVNARQTVPSAVRGGNLLQRDRPLKSPL